VGKHQGDALNPNTARPDGNTRRKRALFVAVTILVFYALLALFHFGPFGALPGIVVILGGVAFEVMTLILVLAIAACAYAYAITIRSRGRRLEK